MDCLFKENELPAMNYYIQELEDRNLQGIIYIAPDFDLVAAGMIKLTGLVLPPVTDRIIYNENGFIGQYHGLSLYVFDGLDSHTCCIMPRYE